MNDICINSKEVSAGDIFVAIPCKDVDNHIDEAIANGATLIVSDNIDHTNHGFLYTNDVRLVASKLAAFRYNESPENCVAVTGTNGKSSVVYFLSQIWKFCDIKSACLGTNGMFINGTASNEIEVPKLTTPDCVNLHKILSFSKKKGIDHFAFEASSHAIDQKRLHSVKLKVAAFTNLAIDHLDYHGSQQSYFESKQKLFTEIGADIGVFSLDDIEVFNILKNLNKNFITFGLDERNDVHVSNIRTCGKHTNFDVRCHDKKLHNVKMNVFGRLQITNVACSIACAIASGISFENATKYLDRMECLDGRLEHITDYNGASIYVDYAHTAHGFMCSLSEFKNNCKARLIVVFGCGGGRDVSKRKLFGEIAAKIADISIVTDDNPRLEDPSAIRGEIIEHCRNALEIPSRKEAIKQAILMLGEGDVLVVIGKGHETTQIYKNETLSHNDKDCILAITT